MSQERDLPVVNGQEIKLNWDPSVFYDSPEDPRIEEDLNQIIDSFKAFTNTHQETDLKDPEQLKDLLNDYAHIYELAQANKPLKYLFMVISLDTADEATRNKRHLLETKYSEAFSKTSFFKDQLSNLSDLEWEHLLTSDSLSDYQFYLFQIYESSRFRLSPEQEQIITQFKSLYPLQHADLIQALHYGAQTLPKANLNIVYAPFAKAEYVGRIRGHLIETKLRGYENPFSFRFSQSEITQEQALELIDVTTQTFPLSHRFSQIHARLLQKEKLGYSDRAKRIGKYSFEPDLNTSIDIIRETFASIDRLNFIDNMLLSGQIDFFPSLDKSTTSFASLGPNEYNLAFINFREDLGSLLTPALHELGHSFDGSLLYQNPNPLYRSHFVAVSEVPSKLMELIGADVITRYLDQRDQIIFLDHSIGNLINSMFFLTANFNFEVELHNLVGSGADVSHKIISSLWTKHMQAFLGDTFVPTESNSYNWVNIKQLRAFFCSHCYITGAFIATHLHEQYRQDPSYWHKIEEFMASGTSQPLSHSLGKLGITLNRDFWLSGLKRLERQIDLLESMTAHYSL